MTTEDRVDDAEIQSTLRAQEAEFYEALTGVLANLPVGTTVDDASALAGGCQGAPEVDAQIRARRAALRAPRRCRS